MDFSLLDYIDTSQTFCYYKITTKLYSMQCIYTTATIIDCNLTADTVEALNNFTLAFFLAFCIWAFLKANKRI